MIKRIKKRKGKKAKIWLKKVRDRVMEIQVLGKEEYGEKIPKKFYSIKSQTSQWSKETFSYFLFFFLLKENKKSVFLEKVNREKM